MIEQNQCSKDMARMTKYLTSMYNNIYITTISKLKKYNISVETLALDE